MMIARKGPSTEKSKTSDDFYNIQGLTQLINDSINLIQCTYFVTKSSSQSYDYC